MLSWPSRTAEVDKEFRNSKGECYATCDFKRWHHHRIRAVRPGTSACHCGRCAWRPPSAGGTGRPSGRALHGLQHRSARSWREWVYGPLCGRARGRRYRCPYHRGWWISLCLWYVWPGCPVHGGSSSRALSQNEEARGVGAPIHPGRQSASRTAGLQRTACSAVA